jgi:hypothetical protein
MYFIIIATIPSIQRSDQENPKFVGVLDMSTPSMSCDLQLFHAS